jgi:hypothetical protein
LSGQSGTSRILAEAEVARRRYYRYYAGGVPTRSRSPRGRGLNTQAAAIVDAATGADQDPQPTGKDPAAVALGRRGGAKGGPAKAAKLSPERRQAIARTAASKRWAARGRQDA